MVSELRAREEKVWGSTKHPSKIEIRLEIRRPGQPCSIEGYPAYALFPFKEDQQQLAARGQVGVSFRLHLRYPKELAVDASAAMWAWISFGGIGARTRRGAGALYCAEEAPAGANGMQAWVRGRVEEYGLLAKSAPLRAWPVLDFVPGYKPRLGPNTHASAVAAWEDAIGVLRDFRQGQPGRSPGPGRSRWPEADSIRALTTRSELRHARSVTLANPAAEPGFPRADFGLPIVLKFVRRDSLDTPNNCTINPIDPVRNAAASRMASQVVLRPFKTVDGKFRAMIVRLYAARPRGVDIEFDDKTVSIPESTVLDRNTICRPGLSAYPRVNPPSPMQGRTKGGSALEAFLAFAKDRGFQEVL